MKDTYRERQRHNKREKQALPGDPDAGLNSRTPGSWAEPKAGTQPLSHPGTPLFFFKIFFIYLREGAYMNPRGRGRGRGRERISSRLYTEHRAQHEASSHDPEITIWAETKSWTLNQPCPSGARHVLPQRYYFLAPTPQVFWFFKPRAGPRNLHLKAILDDSDR